MVTKPKDTQHKIYINIKVYQTNSPPKLVTSKAFFLLTWSSPPKSITPFEEWHSILKILSLFDMIVKGHKRPKNLTGDRQKIDIEETRRTRNHRPTRKRQTRCYGHKGKKNAKQRKMKCMQGYLDRSRRYRESIEKKPTSMDRESFEDVSSRQRAQDFDLMDLPICRKAVEVKPRNLDRRGICRDSIEKLSRMQKRGFSRGKNT